LYKKHSPSEILTLFSSDQMHINTFRVASISWPVTCSLQRVAAFLEALADNKPTTTTVTAMISRNDMAVWNLRIMAGLVGLPLYE
jgi:hypothetical protein